MASAIMDTCSQNGVEIFEPGGGLLPATYGHNPLSAAQRVADSIVDSFGKDPESVELMRKIAKEVG